MRNVTDLVGIIGGAFMGMALTMQSAFAEHLTTSGVGVNLNRIYRESIYDSAVKRPSFRRKLTPIDARLPKVTVVTLTTKDDDPIDPRHPFLRTKGNLKLDRRPGNTGVLLWETWVSLPSESRPACRGARDPVLALEQILGMPPVGGDWELVQFSVAPKHIFRPCASSPNITTTQCSFTLPTHFSSDAERRAVEEAQLFVFGQMWSSYIAAFPESGYPFTGMGWTYNWNPVSKDHFGVSEYVVRPNAPVSDIRIFTPAQFCNGR